MIAYEVEALLQVVDRASPQMEKVLALSGRLQASWDRLKQSGAGLFAGTGGRGFAGQLGRINAALPQTIDLLTKMGAAAEAGFSAFGGGAERALSAVRALNAEMRASAGAAARGFAGVAGTGGPFRGGPGDWRSGTMAPFVAPGTYAGAAGTGGALVPYAPLYRRPAGRPYVPGDDALYAGSAASQESMFYGPTSRTRGAGREPTAGGGGAGFHATGNVPFPLGPFHGHVRFRGTGGLVAAGAMGYGLFEDMRVQDAIERTLLIVGDKALAAGSRSEITNRLRQEILDAYTATGLPLGDVVEAMPAFARLMQTAPFKSTMAIFPQIVDAAAMETRLKGGSLAGNVTAMTELMHQTGVFDAATIAKLLPAFTYASIFDPSSIQAMVRTTGYAVPMLRTMLGVDPIDIIMGASIMHAAGISNTKAGTWAESAIESLFPGTKNLTGHQAAMQRQAQLDLGLIDAQGKPLLNNQLRRHPMAAIATIAAHLQGMSPPQRVAELTKLAGKQGARYIGFFSDPQVQQVASQLMAGLSGYGERQGEFWNSYNRLSSLQTSRQTIAEFNRSLIDVSNIVLPAFTDGLRGVTVILKGFQSFFDHFGLGGWGTTGEKLAVGAGTGAAGGAIIAGPPGALVGGAIGVGLTGLGSMSNAVAAAIAHPKSLKSTERQAALDNLFGPIFGSLFSSDNASSGADDHVVGKLASAIKLALNGTSVQMDGKEVGQIVTDHQANEARRPPADSSTADTRLSPLYPNYAIP